MKSSIHKAIAIVGVGAVLPDAPDVPSFWSNLTLGRYSIRDVPPELWNPDFYYDPDPKAPEKAYSKIGGFVTEWPWEPLKWRLPIPPKVSDGMDRGQKWAILATRQALQDVGHFERPLDADRTGVILGNAMAGDKHYMTALKIFFPEYADELEHAPSFEALPAATRAAVVEELHAGIRRRLPVVDEDTMPGELSNIIAGRVANVFDFHGPNFVTDAACASAMAAITAAIESLEEYDVDAVVTGGIDANMSASSFIKFCKIGALSATGTRPYAAGADGFVMGEGAGIFVLKRLADAERAGDKIYAVLRGMGGSSDGRGKGITAPNPRGQRLAVERAWANAARVPGKTTMIEGHGTSTRVGDVVEVESLADVFRGLDLPTGSIPLGSVKSNIGHLKGAAGAAGIMKAALALHHKTLPPSLNFERPNPNIDFSRSPFAVNTKLRPWEVENGDPRRAGVSAFGFGGTNFHAVLEEYVPGVTREENVPDRSSTVAVPAAPSSTVSPSTVSPSTASAAQAPARATVKPPPRGALLLGAATEAELVERLRAVQSDASAGRAPDPAPPAEADLRALERLAIDYGDASELAAKAARAMKAFESGRPAAWKALGSQGVFRGSGKPGKVAFLYTGQGSQYVNMLRLLADREPVVAETFARADRVMTPILGRPLTELLFIDGDEAAIGRATEKLRQTALTQPAVLAVDIALTRLLAEYGIEPDMVMGHSLGEYGALVGAGCLSFAEALEAVSARGQEMSKVSVADNGMMAAVSAPLEEIELTLTGIDGYVVVANINSKRQAVIGGATEAVELAVEAFREKGRDVRPLSVSHAFHTAIVAPASAPLARMMRRLHLKMPKHPIVSNVTGDFYPSVGPGRDEPSIREEMIDLLGRQIASPVQFVKGLENLYDAGARVFVEVGPKRALATFVRDVLSDRDDVSALFTNHPRTGDVASVNQALCGFYAAGVGRGASAEAPVGTAPSVTPPVSERLSTPQPRKRESSMSTSQYQELGHLFADFLDRGFEIYSGQGGGGRGPSRAVRDERPVVVTGAALGLPGTPRIFDDQNVERLLNGIQLIDVIPTKLRQAMLEKNVTRLVKHDGNPRFETIHDPGEVIKLAGRGGAFDLVEEFGFSEDRAAALDVTTALAIGAGLDALRDAGLPLVMRYKTTSKGTFLPERWMLPETLRDTTGIIFASAFPGVDYFAEQSELYHADRTRRARLAELEDLRTRVASDDVLAVELDRRIASLRSQIEREAFAFDRRFLFRLLSMGHSQFAEYIGARGPNTQINSACASTSQAMSLAEDWIRRDRCERVVIISADDVTSDHLMEWIGAGFLATGAAATDDVVEEAALPFDRRRHGMLIGMGAAAIVVEEPASAEARGLRPICEVLSTETKNSAFHGTRLDVGHICGVMESLVRKAEERWGIDRHAIAAETVFVSHETYTPARGGSAAAEIHALRQVFGDAASRIVIANTKGFTGHPMAVGIEDVVAIKALETGLVPPVPNFREIDPELGDLNLSRGGAYPVRFALRLAAGFGSQISLTLTRWVPTADGRRPSPNELGYASRVTDPTAFQAWLDGVSGLAGAEIEIDRRTLRVKDRGAPGRRGEKIEEVGVSRSVSEPGVDTPGYHLPPSGLGPSPSPSSPRHADGQETFVGHQVEPPAPTSTFRSPGGAADSSQGREPLEEVAATTPAVQTRVLEIVAEKTGYPPDMLDLDLDLEADLGIDTVKQAETFAALRAEWDIPRDDNMTLRDYPTLGHAIEFVYKNRPDLKAAPAPAPVAAEAPAPAPAEAHAIDAVAPAADAVQGRVLEIVAEKTGYPPDMLDLDLDLEADLGIDTVKQAETFAALRSEWDIPRDDNMTLRDYPTLGHAIEFVYKNRPDLRGGGAIAPAAASSPPPASAEATTPPPLTGSLEAADAIPRRVPKPVLRPPIAHTKPTAVALETGRRVAVMPDRGGVGKALVARLEKRGVDVVLLDPSGDADAMNALLVEKPVDGLYWLPALDDEGDPLKLDRDAWRKALHLRVKLLEAATRVLYERLGDADAFLVAATRLGGLHGVGEDGASAPLGGAVTGFVKTIKRERPSAVVKAVDFAPSRKTAALADHLVEETLNDPGAVELGYRDGRRWTVALVEEPVGTVGGEGLDLGPESVYLVTGAAGSIVSAIVADLATAGSGGTFHLLDLAPEPDPDDEDLRRFQSDRDGLKRDLFERLKARGERATPAKVEKDLAGLERRHAALQAIETIERSGGEACYHQVNLLDADAVAAVVEEIRRAHARVDVLIHAAGLEISHRLPDKPAEEFDLVFDVKADGLYHLLSSLGETEVGAVVGFSSIAGRFGNAGQADYAAANDLLSKLAASFCRTRPETRGLTIDWTAWGGLGMATRGSIPKMMELAKIDMLPPEGGIPIVRRELTAGDVRGEVLIAQGLGVLLEEWDETGGLDPATFDVPPRPMAGEVKAFGVESGLVVETTLDPTEQPFLYDHQIEGTPVLPGVMGLEAFAEAARLVLPDWHVAAVEDMRFLQPFKLYRGEPRTVRVVMVIRHGGGEIFADARLLGERRLPNQPEPQVTTHFTGRIRLTPEAPVALTKKLPEAGDHPVIGKDVIYRVFFHGPAYRVLESVWGNSGSAVGLFPEDLPTNHVPETSDTLMAPRLVELCFQTAGVWEIGRTGKMGLPREVARVRRFGNGGPAQGRLQALVEPAGDDTGETGGGETGGTFRAWVVDEAGTVHVALEGYRTIELPGGVDTAGAKEFRSALR